ncbi:MAG TPA: FAD-dependent oxidoreductase [Solirubrobacterales bacterium]
MFRVLIAGGGVAALEALLALRELVGARAEIELLAPRDDYVYRQLAVAEPFSAGEATRLPLTELIEAAGGHHRRAALREVRPEERIAVTDGGEELAYDALLLAIGARPVEALPGAITYRGFESNAEMRRAVLDLDHGEISSISFAVPTSVRWALPLYELALLSAWHLGEIGDRDVELHLVTHELEPLGLFGERAGGMVRELLSEAGINLHTQAAPARVEPGVVRLVGGGAIRGDRVIAMPRLEVDPIPGIPQGPHGFIGTDREMRVEGLPRVFAAGDATWFPINQGGIAAQQADAAASAIAAAIDDSIEARPFRPVLRGAILTGKGPRYLRSEIGDRDGASAASKAPLWWPPGKVAGRYLAPFLTAQANQTEQLPPPLADLEAPLDEYDERKAEDHDDAVRTCLLSADSDARWGDYEAALRWLAAAEQLQITLPPDYAIKREQWRAAAEAARVP